MKKINSNGKKIKKKTVKIGNYFPSLRKWNSSRFFHTSKLSLPEIDAPIDWFELRWIRAVLVLTAIPTAFIFGMISTVGIEFIPLIDKFEIFLVLAFYFSGFFLVIRAFYNYNSALWESRGRHHSEKGNKLETKIENLDKFIITFLNKLYDKFGLNFAKYSFSIIFVLIIAYAFLFKFYELEDNLTDYYLIHYFLTFLAIVYVYFVVMYAIVNKGLMNSVFDSRSIKMFGFFCLIFSGHFGSFWVGYLKYSEPNILISFQKNSKRTSVAGTILMQTKGGFVAFLNGTGETQVIPMHTVEFIAKYESD